MRNRLVITLCAVVSLLAGAGQQGYHGAEGNDQPVPHAMPSTTRSWVTSVPEPS